MRVIRHVDHVGSVVRPRVVAAGRFDGVHRGHQRVLARVVEEARRRGGEAIAIVARERDGPPRLTDTRRQLELLRDAGVDAVVFARLADTEAAVEGIGAAVRVTALGSAARAPRGGALDEIAPLDLAGLVITSDAIRTALQCGDLALAGNLLGRAPEVGGRIGHGFHRGAGLGIPTANLRLRGIQIPPDGVYAVRARIAGMTWHGVANIGFNPTFGNDTRTVETHLLDFDDDVYGCRLNVSFVARLRGEQKFPDVTALVAQINADIVAARRLFAQHDG